MRTRPPARRAHLQRSRRTSALHPYDLPVPILEGADVRLNYFVTGEGAPVTLLHGFTQSGRSWQEVISIMPAGWRWVVPDLRGHGETRSRPGAPITMDACTADLEMLWDELGIQRTHLVGYSMGGRLALHVAARRPERLLSALTPASRRRRVRAGGGVTRRWRSASSRTASRRSSSTGAVCRSSPASSAGVHRSSRRCAPSAWATRWPGLPARCAEWAPG